MFESGNGLPCEKVEIAEKLKLIAIPNFRVAEGSMEETLISMCK